MSQAGGSQLGVQWPPRWWYVSFCLEKQTKKHKALVTVVYFQHTRCFCRFFYTDMFTGKIDAVISCSPNVWGNMIQIQPENPRNLLMDFSWIYICTVGFQRLLLFFPERPSFYYGCWTDKSRGSCFYGLGLSGYILMGKLPSRYPAVVAMFLPFWGVHDWMVWLETLYIFWVLCIATPKKTKYSRSIMWQIISSFCLFSLSCNQKTSPKSSNLPIWRHAWGITSWIFMVLRLRWLFLTGKTCFFGR